MKSIHDGILKTTEDKMNYTKYRGKTCGRILHALEVYRVMRVDEVIVGDKEVYLFGNKLAQFSWEEGDTPDFIFHGENRKEYTRNQFFKKPFLDDHFTLIQLDYCVQEIKKLISL